MCTRSRNRRQSLNGIDPVLGDLWMVSREIFLHFFSTMNGPQRTAVCRKKLVIPEVVSEVMTRWWYPKSEPEVVTEIMTVSGTESHDENGKGHNWKWYQK